jgi:hypothetical protein
MAKAKKTATAVAGAAEAFEPDALAIRTCDPGGTSYGGFQWPMEVGSIVTCPDWRDSATCGNGLHGLLDGIGDWELTARDNAVWQVVGVIRGECVDIDGGKVKFPRCRLEYVGSFAQAMQMVQKATVTKLLELAKGNTATGDSGHAAATGDSGHAAATGDRGHAAATGYSGHAAATGYSGHAAATGEHSIAASIGWNGTAEAGPKGGIVLAHFNDDGELTHLFAAKVGERGIKAGKRYRLGADGKPVEA